VRCAPRPIAAPAGGRRPRVRRLYQIREGQQIAGVCKGLSAYSDIRADWVRTIFFFLGLVTFGAFLVVYGVMAFVRPIADTKAEWLALMDQAAESGAS
jgi:phage shock protein PspC (stress-responsive transcriptional regulator)